jgi:AbrB family looped-hinge helix DNA binding protein
MASSSMGLGAVILTSVTTRVGPKGQVVIPQQLRAELGIQPGDEVEVWRDGDHVIVRLVQSSRPLLGRYAGEPLTDVLVAERFADRERENRRS